MFHGGHLKVLKSVGRSYNFLSSEAANLNFCNNIEPHHSLRSLFFILLPF